jgi:hypothetical protein
MSIRRELIDELLADYPNPQDILGEGGLLKQLTKAVIERCLETELDVHLGYPKHARAGNPTGNVRNGSSQKTLKGEQGHIDIQVPRDRQARFEPHLVQKGQTRLEGFDEKILTLYARGMTTRVDRSRCPGPAGPCGESRAQSGGASRRLRSWNGRLPDILSSALAFQRRRDTAGRANDRARRWVDGWSSAARGFRCRRESPAGG